MIFNKFPGQIIFTFIIVFAFNCSFAQSTETDLKITILLDASASMKKTDPDGIRKLAAQAVVSLLTDKDQISIIEYDSDARILSNWKSAGERDALFDAIDKASDNGAFTDFRAGLEKALDVFKKENGNSRKIILLLSDGVFEPNLFDSKYAPYHLKYRLAKTGKDREERKKITEQFRKIITPVATRMIESEILPALKEKQIEIYTIAFSPNAERDFMRHLAKATNLSNETHAFYADDATDLVESFLSLLHYWENIITLYSEKGAVVIGGEKRIFVDQYIEQPLAILLTRERVGFSLMGEDGKKEDRIEGTHPNLQLFPIEKTRPPAYIKYSFINGEGNYRFLFIGKSALVLTATNLKEKYNFGEQIKCLVKLEYRGKDARPLIDRDSYILAEIISSNDQRVTQVLGNESEGYLLNFSPKQSGDFRLRFTAYVKNEQGKELLPRPGKEYAVKVLPRLYVEPERLDFGNVGKGKNVNVMVTIHSGLSKEINLKVSDQIKTASRCANKAEKLPGIHKEEFVIKPGEIVQKELKLEIPKNGCWGDYGGEIYFKKADRKLYKISYIVHIPSIWEYLTYPTIFLLLLGIILLGALVYLWGTLGKPKGVLMVLQRPLGTITSNSYPLNQVRQKNFFARIFNWRVNNVSIGIKNADIELPSLDPNLRIELVFVRLGNHVYLFNKSSMESKIEIKVIKPSMANTPYNIRPGRNIIITHDTIIEIDGFKLKYVNF